MKKRSLACALLITLLCLTACSPAPVQSVRDSATLPSTEPFAAEQTDKEAEQPTAVDTAPSAQATNGSTHTSPATKQAQTTAGTTKNAQVVSLTVECKNAVAYGIREQAGYAQIIPADGVLLSLAGIPFQEGDTALDLLKRAMKEQQMVLNERNGYIAGIAGLNEKACGSGSGWFYFVNGESPAVSAAGYPVKAGDNIRFAYTCTLGDLQ